MQLSISSKKVCLFLDSDSDQQYKQQQNIDLKKQQIVKFQKIYDFKPIKHNHHPKQDKFTINKFGKNMFINQEETMQFDNLVVEQRVKKTLKKNYKPKLSYSEQYIPNSGKTYITQQDTVQPKKQPKPLQINEVQQKISQLPTLLELKSVNHLPRANKMFHLDLNQTSSEEQCKSSVQQKQQQMSLKEIGVNNNQLLGSDKKFTSKDQSHQRKYDNQNQSVQDQLNQDQQSDSSQQVIQLKDFGFIRGPQFVVLQQIRQDETLRAYISRSRSGFNMIWPQYSVKIQKEDKQLIYVKKASFSVKSCYKMFVRTKNGQQKYFGKLESEYGNNNYKVYMSQDGQQENLRGEIIFPISTSSRQPRFFSMFYLMNGYKLNDLVWLDQKQVGNQKNLRNLHKYYQNKDKIKLFQTRKPTYNSQLKGFVLNFRRRIKVPSIKNFIMEQVKTGKEVLMFGKINKDSFRLQISHPLNCVIGTALAMIQFQYGLSD